VGEVLEQLMGDAEGAVCTRAELFVTSKLWNSAHAAADVDKACRKTLADLRLEYLDLYLIHWVRHVFDCRTTVSPSPPRLEQGESAGGVLTLAPSLGCAQPVTGKKTPTLTPPMKETWAAMEALVDAGLVRAIGVANFSTKKLRELLATATVPPAVNQVEMHPFLRQEELLQFCQAEQIVVTAFSSLGSPDSDFGSRPSDPYWVTLGARWVTLRARWVALRARWVALRARCVTLRARWVALRARWVALRARWVTLRARWVALRARWVALRDR
jgi:alcohol dehydrogenase (NADP+)